MAVKVICNICRTTDDWRQGGEPFFVEGAKGVIYPDSGSETPVQHFDICGECIDKYIAPLFEREDEESKA